MCFGSNCTYRVGCDRGLWQASEACCAGLSLGLISEGRAPQLAGSTQETEAHQVQRYAPQMERWELLCDTQASAWLSLPHSSLQRHGRWVQPEPQQDRG